ncbi:glycerophosphodiester phosphodiesterase family protein [Spiroplasma sp. BIUS-1]|uniref:glycerophosphodiester phosphodiesterase family protein n=1 Tax=Spiroplasma sp. BIUS-1 TaxID=216964 RepID=UPI001398EC36|nr:glycerophosphodiester phosphodiesterase family protein [Spiroplasma sp. BIUS-1]QHX36918.1 hypothetical protein SBIUS_v1c06650 [Spiroplasma sp. BIUS-1]
MKKAFYFLLSIFLLLSSLLTVSCSNYDYARQGDPILIAHAGGAIDGNSYTNSLDAMNKSYEDGFRYFELDFMTTSDDKIVAIHDWDRWFKDNNKKKIPTHEEFMNSKIKGKYSPLDIATLNVWFKEHEDAYLITDKINDPKRFLTEFDYPKRTYMELFSKQAVIEANEIGFGNTLLSLHAFTYGDKLIDFMLENNVKYITTSYNVSPRKKKFIKKAKSKDISTFFFFDANKPVTSEKMNDKYNYIDGFYLEEFSQYKPQ